MFKYLIILLFGAVVTSSAYGMAKDTSIYYYKKDKITGVYKNCSPDSFSFVRFILPPDSGAKLLNIKDYYKNGKIKLIAKARINNINLANGEINFFDEQYISYYENGNRQTIRSFEKEKTEYFEYYLNGKLSCNKVLVFGKGLLLWDCFDNEGKLICDKGNGRWIRYDDDYKTIVEQGSVKNGLREGEWHVTDYLLDTISFIANYKRGISKSGTSYDKKGHVFSFDRNIEIAMYQGGGYLDFFNDIKSNFKHHIDSEGKKMSFDTTRVSFIVELNGKLSDVKVLEKVEPKLMDAMLDAIAKCKSWNCRKYYGIPYRSKMTLALLYTDDGSTHQGLDAIRPKTIEFKEEVLAP